MLPAERRRVVAPVALAVAAVALAAFLPALGLPFVEWDDDRNFLNNPHYRGLGWTQLRWMFTSAVLGHWTPVTWITLGLDSVVWGMNPLGYHLTSVLLHAANAAVLFLIGCRLLRAAQPQATPAAVVTGAAVAALFFALHPLRVESVAWVTERRDVLSGLFYLLTILAYLATVDAPAAVRPRRYVTSLALFALALMSKSIVISLPLVLVLLDVYPLRRLPPPGGAWLTPAARRVLLEKAPYAAMALIGGVAAAATMSKAVGLTSAEAYSLSDRLGIAAYAVVFYVWKTLVPLDLSPLYELPARVDLAEPRFLLAALGVLLVTAALVAMRRRWPAGLAAWLAYGVTLAPVSGLVHAGRQLVADRYAYLACLGFALLVGAAVTWLAASARARAALAGVAVGLAALTSLTWGQIQVWKDTDAIWRQALAVDPDCAFCHRQWGAILGNRGALEPALAHFRRAVELRPDRVSGHGNIGLVLLRAGRAAEAVPHFERVLQAMPGDADTRNRLGAALMQQHKLAQARAELERAVIDSPRHADALTNLGLTLTDLGSPADGVRRLEEALALAPQSLMVRFGLARAYRHLGRYDAAAPHLDIVRRLDPALAERALQR